MSCKYQLVHRLMRYDFLLTKQGSGNEEFYPGYLVTDIRETGEEEVAALHRCGLSWRAGQVMWDFCWTK
jgi:hypothetical protein